jgi:hypothetical protein
MSKKCPFLNDFSSTARRKLFSDLKLLKIRKILKPAADLI